MKKKLCKDKSTVAFLERQQNVTHFVAFHSHTVHNLQVSRLYRHDVQEIVVSPTEHIEFNTSIDKCWDAKLMDGLIFFSELFKLHPL